VLEKNKMWARLCRFVPVCAGLCCNPFFCGLIDCSPPFSDGGKKCGQNRGQLVSKAPISPKKLSLIFLEELDWDIRGEYIEGAPENTGFEEHPMSG
jgi:hypothetical protein